MWTEAEKWFTGSAPELDGKKYTKEEEEEEGGEAAKTGETWLRVWL